LVNTLRFKLVIAGSNPASSKKMPILNHHAMLNVLSFCSLKVALQMDLPQKSIEYIVRQNKWYKKIKIVHSEITPRMFIQYAKQMPERDIYMSYEWTVGVFYDKNRPTV
jgi:hypothetical protein